MKKKAGLAAICLATLIACNSGSDTQSGPYPDSANNADTAKTNVNTNANNISTTPVSREDSSFIMEAAIGGIMEVESGRIAQQNGQSERVKNFGAMMVRDHEKANQELMGFASSRGMSLPTTLPADKQQHMESMKKMKGRSFDSHYMNMMVQDHQKTISLFEKQASSGGDAQLRTWAGNTLPILRMHLDSAQAIKKGM